MKFWDNQNVQQKFSFIPTDLQVHRLFLGDVIQEYTFVHSTSSIYRVPSPPPKKISHREVLLIKANDIATNIACKKLHSKYSHLNTIMDVYYYYNCYGFINHCIQKAVPEAYNELVKGMWSLGETVPVSFDELPCPFNYAAIFQNLDLRYWERVTEFKEIRPGDIIVYLPLNYTPRTSPGENSNKRTGTHVMMVQYALGTKGESYAFSIIDCTQKAHCEEDSRYPDESGIGTSSLFITPVKENHCVLKWGENDKSYDKNIFVGRLRDTDVMLQLLQESPVFSQYNLV